MIFLFFNLVFAKKPNVIIILADDLGMGDLSLNNAQGKIKTPNIDRIGLEGVNFLDAHSPSSKCSPSRYMTMTGRYDFDNSRHPSKRRLDPGTPHLAELFKRNGYRTGIVGKHQPIADTFQADDIPREEYFKILKQGAEYAKSLGGGTGERGRGEHKKSFYTPSNYSMQYGPHTRGYDYSFLNQYACCRVGGGYFENGKGTEPFNKYAIQRLYPEHEDGSFCATMLTGKQTCARPFGKGHLAPPHFDERIERPVYIPNHPASILVQASYDSRDIERRLADKAVEFIRESANNPDPFFLYCGFRAGHNPFNTPIEYRNKSEVGVIGEATMELDDIVGDIMDTLENLGIDEDTLVVFMSDNGAINSDSALTAVRTDGNGDFTWNVFGHYQNSIDIRGENFKLRAGKSSAYEGGHRVPFLFRYPAVIKAPKVVESTVVSYIDLYRTLADAIGETEFKCTEAPDSVSLWPILTGSGQFPEYRPVLHHSIFDGNVAIRQNDWKLIPGRNELYNLRDDIQELVNRYEERPDKVQFLTEKLERISERINARNKRTKQGQLEEFC